MAQDWAENVRKYVPDADGDLIAGIVRYCGISLQKRDSSLVSIGDPAETDRVRQNFLKKKLGLTDADDILDAAIAAVGETMKGESFKNRVTVYYLLADRFGKLELFRKNGSSASAAVGAAAAGGALGIASMVDSGPAANETPGPSTGEPVRDPAVAATGAAGGDSAAGAAAAGSVGSAAVADRLTGGGSGGGSASVNEDSSGSFAWLWWLLGLLLLGFLIWWLLCRDADHGAEKVVTSEASAPVVDTAAMAGDSRSEQAATLAAAPAEGMAAIPAGAGVTSELRAGKPVVKVYFDTGKTEVAPALAPAASGLKAWLEGNVGSSLAISGYSDPSGNAALNTELAKNRAIAVRTALIAAGIPGPSVDLVKPEQITDAAVSPEAARRVEVVVR